MPNQIKHPTTKELSAFALGDLPLEVADHVEQHISDCDTCCETIVGLASDDTFLGLLQEARAEDRSSQETIAATASNRGHEIPKPLQAHSRYEIQQLVGRGGMGCVYKARHRMMDRDVALKVIHREWVTRREVIDRFRREMKSAASLDHRNIVTAHDAEHADDLHFLVMEYVDGNDLAQTVGQNGPLPVEQACDFIRQAAEGLHHAHQRGMVHRDIKPHNLIVTKDNVVKILDFGLASLSPQLTTEKSIIESTDSNLTTAGAIMGTPDFISPEQAADARSVDGRSDIYSLGMTLYYLLSGRVPFADGGAMEKLKQHADSEPTPLSQFREDVPVELQNIVRRMTAKDPAKRFQTPKEVAAALSEITDVWAIAETKSSTEPFLIGTAFKAMALIGLLLVVVVTALQFAGLFKRDTSLDEVHAPLSELKSYVHSMMASPHDLVFLNVGRIGPDKNYVTFKPIENGVLLRIPAFEGPYGTNRQGKYIERFKTAAAAASLSITEKSELNESGSISGVVYSVNVFGDSRKVAEKITALVAETFSVQPIESCKYQYRNLPASAFGKEGVRPRRVSGEEFVAEHARAKRVYYGEESNWIYLVPADRLNDKKMQRDDKVWYANINELPSGAAGRIRSARSDVP